MEVGRKLDGTIFFFIEEGEWNKSFIFSFLLCSQRGEEEGAVP